MVYFCYYHWWCINFVTTGVGSGPCILVATTHRLEIGVVLAAGLLCQSTKVLVDQGYGAFLLVEPNSIFGSAHKVILSKRKLF